VSSRTSALVAALAVTCAVAGTGTAAPQAPRASCGSATPLKTGSLLRFGPVTVVGFSNYRCASITLGCGPNRGGYQASLALELSQRLTSPIVFHATSRSGTVRFVLVRSTTPAPEVPRCMSGRPLRAAVTLRAPAMYYVLYVFAPKDDSFRLSASRGSRQLGTAVVAVQHPR
jgi:hypothetical protein